MVVLCLRSSLLLGSNNALRAIEGPSFAHAGDARVSRDKEAEGALDAQHANAPYIRTHWPLFFFVPLSLSQPPGVKPPPRRHISGCGCGSTVTGAPAGGAAVERRAARGCDAESRCLTPQTIHFVVGVLFFNLGRGWHACGPCHPPTQPPSAFACKVCRRMWGTPTLVKVHTPRSRAVLPVEKGCGAASGTAWLPLPATSGAPAAPRSMCLS